MNVNKEGCDMQKSDSNKPLSAEQKRFAEELFCENYDLLSKRIYELLRNIDPSAAEDCLGNLFLTLCLSIDRVLEHENPRAWLFKTAKFICLKHIRNVGYKTKRNQPLEEDIADGISMEDAVIDDILYCQWQKEDAKEKLINELNENEREILHLSVQQRLSNREIGEKLGKSEDAVRFTLYYIRKKISDRIYSGKI